MLAGTPALIPNPTPRKDKKNRPSKEKTMDVPDGSGTGAEAAIERDNPPEPGRERASETVLVRGADEEAAELRRSRVGKAGDRFMVGRQAGR